MSIVRRSGEVVAVGRVRPRALRRAEVEVPREIQQVDAYIRRHRLERAGFTHFDNSPTRDAQTSTPVFEPSYNFIFADAEENIRFQRWVLSQTQFADLKAPRVSFPLFVAWAQYELMQAARGRRGGEVDEITLADIGPSGDADSGILEEAEHGICNAVADAVEETEPGACDDNSDETTRSSFSNFLEVLKEAFEGVGYTVEESDRQSGGRPGKAKTVWGRSKERFRRLTGCFKCCDGREA